MPQDLCKCTSPVHVLRLLRVSRLTSFKILLVEGKRDVNRFSVAMHAMALQVQRKVTRNRLKRKKKA